MDRELEEQIDDLIHKATKDLKTRIVRIVVRNQNKRLKEQARELKNGGATSRKEVRAPSRAAPSRPAKKSSSSSSNSRYHSDSDSDNYYSE